MPQIYLSPEEIEGLKDVVNLNDTPRYRKVRESLIRKLNSVPSKKQTITLQNAWCSCKHVDENDILYREDNQCSCGCGKHHYHHVKCGKIY